MPTERNSAPATVKAAATILALVAAWQAYVRVWPAVSSTDPEGLSELLDVAIELLVVWGLLTLRRWAWWLAVLSAGAGVAIPLVILGAFGPLELESEIPHPELVIEILTAIGAISFVILALLLTPSSRDAFRK